MQISIAIFLNIEYLFDSLPIIPTQLHFVKSHTTGASGNISYFWNNFWGINCKSSSISNFSCFLYFIFLMAFTLPIPNLALRKSSSSGTLSKSSSEKQKSLCCSFLVSIKSSSNCLLS